MLRPNRSGSQTRNVTTRNVSLSPIQNLAVLELARRAGHQNASRVIQDLIAREARAEIGSDWHVVLNLQDHESTEAVAS